MSCIIEDYEGWLKLRASKLSKLFQEDYEDCYQTLALYLLESGSQKTAWLKSVTELWRARRKDQALGLCYLEDLLADDDLSHESLLGAEDPELALRELKESLFTCLPEEEHWVLLMVSLDWSRQDIASALGISLRQVGYRIQSARETMRREL